MVRVLVLCEYASLNGGEHSLLEAACCIPPGKVEWCFAAPPSGPLADRLRQWGWHHASLVCTDEQGRRTPRGELRGRLTDLIQRYRPHVVHANSVAMSRLAGPVVQDLGVPGLGHLRDIVKLSSTSVSDVSRHGRLLAVSEATRSWYESWGVPAAQMRVEYNGVDLTRFAPRPATGFLHAELGLEPGTRLVGTIGQIGMRKGTDDFLTAAAGASAAAPDVHFLIVGRRYSQKQEARAFEQQVQAQADRGVLRGRVHWLAVRADIDRVLTELTIYVHAARQEPLGRVLLESAASGLPIVATDVGGTREIFHTSTPSALLVPAGAPAVLADRLGELLANAALRQTLREAARRRAEDAFDVRQAARRLLDHYAQVADAGNERRRIS